ncbi:MAG: radical SAM protein [Pseudomonadota bacterium]
MKKQKGPCIMNESDTGGSAFLVTFINVPGHKTVTTTNLPPIGILSMSACLKKEGNRADFIDADACRYGIDQLISLLRKRAPDLIGITMNVGHVYAAAKYIRAIKGEFPGIPIVIGGPYVSVTQKQILNEFPEADYAVAYEGEHAIVELVAVLKGTRKIETVRNLVYRKGCDIKINENERIVDIDALPLPDYGLIKHLLGKYRGVYPTIARPSIGVMCSRGCPFHCGFCSSPSLWGSKVIFRNIDAVIDEIKMLRDTLAVKEVFFHDDTLNVRPGWFIELCDAIIKSGLNEQIYFKCALRVNKAMLSEELLIKAKQANFWMIFYGVENGNQEMLNRMNKGTTIEEIERAFKLTRGCGICTYALLIVGYPGETKGTFADSLALLEKIMPDFSGFAAAIPIPGTEMHRIALEQGLISVTDFKNYQYGDIIMGTSELETRDIAASVNKGYDEISRLASSTKFKKMTEAFGQERFHRMVDGPFYCERRQFKLRIKQMRRCLRAAPFLLAIKRKIGKRHELY